VKPILASLNHANIATIHHVEETGDGPALVMELIEGETLADRIAREPMPFDEALPIACQICEACRGTCRPQCVPLCSAVW